MDKYLVNRAAREQAFAAVEDVSVTPTSLIPLHSEGHLLIIGADEKPLMEALSALNNSGLRISILRIGRGEEEEFEGVKVLYSQNLEVKIIGYLGCFTVTLETAQGNMNLSRVVDIDREHFDLILDLNSDPLLGMETKPQGYHASGNSQELIAKVLSELPEQVGDFEKPVFVQNEEYACAHSRNGQPGCRRCLDVCPALAITSSGEKVEIDPYLCQGGGVCASACPTDAITYAFPKPADTLNRLRVLLNTYHESGGERSCLLFYDEGSGAQRLQNVIELLPANLLPVEVEEIGSLGLDIWFAALAFGAWKVYLLDSPQVTPSVEAEILGRITVAHSILHALGFPRQSITWISRDREADIDLRETDDGMPDIPHADFIGLNEKRRSLFLALDHLHACASVSAEVINLPAGSQFGEVLVNAPECTLCMACASVCPTSALSSGGDHPRLKFHESACIQCGMCVSSCPEKAVSLNPRLLLAPDRREERRVLHEEDPFCCIECGRPFATPSVIERISKQLRGHHMYSNPESIKRLEMCEDCRVVDMFQDGGGSLPV